MDEKQLSIDIVGLAGAYSYALDCCSVTCVLITSKKHDNFARNNFLFVDFST